MQCNVVLFVLGASGHFVQTKLCDIQGYTRFRGKAENHVFWICSPNWAWADWDYDQCDPSVCVFVWCSYTSHMYFNHFHVLVIYWSADETPCFIIADAFLKKKAFLTFYQFFSNHVFLVPRHVLSTVKGARIYPRKKKEKTRSLYRLLPHNINFNLFEGVFFSFLVYFDSYVTTSV